MPAYSESGLDDGEDLSFGNHVVEADQDGFELARGGRSHRNFHLHRFDECNVFAIAGPPTSTGSAQTRPATSVTILMSGIPFSGPSHGQLPLRTAFCCGRRLPEVACSASGILFRTTE